MKSVEQVVEVFRKHGYKITPQRIAILEILENNKSHPSAESIFKVLQKKHPTMSFTTVYNTLQTLHDLGEIQELSIDPNRKHYDPDTSLHHHIMCTRCGAIEDIFVDYSPHLKIPASIRKNYSIDSHQVQFYGICNLCREGKKDC